MLTPDNEPKNISEANNIENYKMGTREIPQLNEDVLGIILKHAVQMEQKRVYEDAAMLAKYTKLPVGYILPDMVMLQKIEWPDYLDSNSRRLTHHTNVKLIPNCILALPNKLRKELKTKHDLDVLWKTLKHFGTIEFWDGDRVYLITWPRQSVGEEAPAMCLQKMWREMQTPSELVKALEERMT